MQAASLTWRNGQPLSTTFDDVYFSREGGMAETEHVFLHNNRLPARWNNGGSFVIAETGFGTGLNFLTTVHHWLQHSDPSACLYYYSIEQYPLGIADLQQALGIYAQLSPYAEELLAVYPAALNGLHYRSLFAGRVKLALLFDDVEDALTQLDIQVDAWYLDGFAPAKNPHMWTEQVFAQMARLSHQHSTLSTYTAAGFVRRGLIAQGFAVNKVNGFANKRDMLRGEMQQLPAKSCQQPWFEPPAFEPAAARHVAIIGAGIAGVTTACALAQRGWQVTLIDQQAQIAAAASGNPQGVVLPRISRQLSACSSFDNSAYVFTLYRLNQLQQQYGDFGWRQSGVIQLPSSRRILQHIEQGNFDVQLARSLDPAECSHYAGLALDTNALLYPLAGYLNPSRLCQTLLAGAGERLSLLTSTRVTELRRQAGQWLLFDQRGSQLLSCDAVVIANGHSVKNFAQSASLPVSAVRGQISYLPANAASRQLACPICYDGYLLPAQHGQHVVGASFKVDDDSDELRVNEHEENMAALQHWLPTLFTDTSVVSGRAAVRAVTADRLPLVGALADAAFYSEEYADLARGRAAYRYAPGRYLPGLYVNVGHGARGLTSSFLCAEILAAQLNNEPAPTYKTVQHVLHPARFMIRALKKGSIVLP